MSHRLRFAAPPDRPIVSASILSADFGAMAADCADALARGADALHVDVMDGHFVPNLTMGADMIRGLRRHLPDAFLDVHLMVERPGDYLDAFADAGADLFAFHAELTTPWAAPGTPEAFDPAALIDRIHAAGMAAGMVVNPPTPIEPIAPLLDQLDLVLVMSVNPGRSGQAFMPEVLDKVRWLRQRVGPHTRIEMDGGIAPATAPQAIAAGADMLVSASALFGAAGDKRTQVIAALKAPPLP